MTDLNTEADIDAYVINVHDRVADAIETICEDPAAAEVVRRAAWLFVAERDITFQDALVALLGQAQTNRERADITRAGEWTRTIAEGLAERRADR